VTLDTRSGIGYNYCLECHTLTLSTPYSHGSCCILFPLPQY